MLAAGRRKGEAHLGNEVKRILSLYQILQGKMTKKFFSTICDTVAADRRTHANIVYADLWTARLQSGRCLLCPDGRRLPWRRARLRVGVSCCRRDNRSPLNTLWYYQSEDMFSTIIITVLLCQVTADPDSFHERAFNLSIYVGRFESETSFLKIILAAGILPLWIFS